MRKPRLHSRQQGLEQPPAYAYACSLYRSIYGHGEVAEYMSKNPQSGGISMDFRYYLPVLLSQ